MSLLFFVLKLTQLLKYGKSFADFQFYFCCRRRKKKDPGDSKAQLNRRNRRKWPWKKLSRVPLMHYRGKLSPRIFMRLSRDARGAGWGYHRAAAPGGRSLFNFVPISMLMPSSIKRDACVEGWARCKERGVARDIYSFVRSMRFLLRPFPIAFFW